MKKYISIFLISVGLAIVIAPLRGGYISLGSLTGTTMSTLVGSICFFIMVIFILKKYRTQLKIKYILLLVIIGALILELPVHFIYFQETLGSLPELIIRLLAILLGYFFYILKNKTGKILIVAGALALFIWTSFYGIGLWNKKFDLGNKYYFSDEYFDMQTHLGDTISLTHFKGNYLILDFFTTNCQECYEKLPVVQEIYAKYKNDTSIQLYAVYCMNTDHFETYKTGWDILREKNYDIPYLAIDEQALLLKKGLKIQHYPTTLILDPLGNVVYKGDIEGVERIISEVKK